MCNVVVAIVEGTALFLSKILPAVKGPQRRGVAHTLYRMLTNVE